MITFFTTFILSSVLYATKPVQASVGEAIAPNAVAASCKDTLVHNHGSNDIERVLSSVAAECESPTACSTPTLRAAFTRAVASLPRPSTAARALGSFVLRAPGRVLVMAVWLGAVGGSGYLAQLLTHGASSEVQAIATTLSVVLAEKIFGRISSPITDQYGPWIEWLGNFAWASSTRWGQISAQSTIAQREAATEVTRLILVIDGYFSEGARMLTMEDVDAAAHYYLTAILTAVDLTAGFNLAEPSVKRKAQFHLRRLGGISPDQAQRLIHVALEHLKTETFIPPNTTAEKLRPFVQETLENWFREVLTAPQLAVEEDDAA